MDKQVEQVKHLYEPLLPSTTTLKPVPSWGQLPMSCLHVFLLTVQDAELWKHYVWPSCRQRKHLRPAHHTDCKYETSIPLGLIRTRFAFLIEMCLITHPWQMVPPDPAETQRQQEIRRRAIARKRAREQFRSGTPEALQGRKHIDVQTGQAFLHFWYIQFTNHLLNVVGNQQFVVFWPLFFRALSRRTEWRHSGCRYWVPDWCFPGQTSDPALHTCQIWQRRWNTDRGGRGKWSKWDTVSVLNSLNIVLTKH